MSILVVCPGCSAKLNAPESAAGKKVKCPKCQTAVPVPALVTEFEVVEPEPAPPPEPPRPAPRPARNADAEDGDDRPRKRNRADDEEDNRPRRRRRDDDDEEEDDRSRKKKVRKAGGVPPVLLFGGIAAAVLAVGFAVYWFGFREESGGGIAQNGPGPGGPNEPNGPKPAAQPVPPPEGWKEFTFERDGFKAYFPAEPKTGATIKSSRSIAGGQPYYRAYEYRSQESWADLACTVRVFELPAASTPQQRQTFADQVCAPSRAETGETVTSQGAATLGGVEGKEAVGETTLRPTATSPKTTSDGRPMPSKIVSVNRWMVTGNRCYHLKVQGHNTRHKDADAFFDNFALTNPPKPKDGGGTPEPKEPPKPITTPAGWAAYQPAGAGFKVLMPTDVKVTDATTKLPSKRGQPMLQSVKLHRSTDAAGVVCEVRVVQFSPVVENSADQSNAIGDVLTAPVFEKRVRSGSGGSKTVTWAGKPARERAFAAGQGVTRETHTATGGIVVAVYVPNGTPDPEKVRAFLDSFEFTN